MWRAAARRDVRVDGIVEHRRSGFDNLPNIDSSGQGSRPAARRVPPQQGGRGPATGQGRVARPPQAKPSSYAAARGKAGTQRNQRSVTAVRVPPSRVPPIRPVQPSGSRRRAAAPTHGGDGVRRGAGAALVLLLIFALLAGAGAWWTMFRQVGVTVNGKTVSMRIGGTAQQLLDGNGYFGARPGRLLSLTGKVLDEQGGERAQVTLAGKQVALDQLAATPVNEGDELSVQNGADVTEGHVEQTVDMAPGIQKQEGGAIQYVSQWGRAGKKRVWKGDRSGETVDKDVVEQPTDLVVASRNPEPAGGRYIALTFDDGPSEYTPQILDILKREGVHATFFNLGEQAAGQPSYVKRVVEDGHELASHTNAHQYLPDLARDALRAEITSAFDRLKEASGETTQMIRAPYGAFDAPCWARSADIISCNVIWNIDTEDWRRPGAEAIKSNVLSNAFNGAIVLMHDGGGDRSEDVAALPGIIEGLKAAGYQLVTVQQLMKLDGGFPQEVYEGTVKVPEGAAMPAA